MLLGLIRRHRFLLGAGLLLCSQSLASAGLINFESIPNGDAPLEGYSISDQFVSMFGVRFSLEDGSAPVLATVGGAETAFLGINSTSDLPDPSANAGSVFLTDDGHIGDAPSALIIEYVTPVSAASAAILDLDQKEGWQIDARDANGNIIDSMQLGINSFGAGNGTAAYWMFSHQTNDIYSIRLSYVGLTQKGIGLAFDNFWTDSIRPNTNIASTPEPGSMALLGTGIVGMLIPAWRKRRQKAEGERKA